MSRIRIFMRDVVIPYAQMSYEIVKPPSQGWNREAYRELAAAGLMYPVSTFAHGPESLFRFTEEGWRRREEWLSGHVPSLLPR